ncbi:Uncharacterized membrane protein YqaE,-like protein of Blt101, UPF0057 family [Geosmithia morbida]|uniref:Uncharacterized membrane protein YqaE,-like protein of Blt101, UPF0057 family n=1 Tax=Geosmithia morbida TaxID=1094350 RepID=A0A9P4YP02_9HYPO|nr:Uncharacterized membrane protein YqaE,-like protein of Blt101, UPF0057 family [Geosmithia morbida]KAF4120473.1 Uncharacterized membrane protein YqaE,-like protein of Blt101, UPF0057 family [Geosmithia morbida]
MGVVSAVLAVLITIFSVTVPPVGVFLVAGCGMDLFINICLTLLGYIPGHIHAFYLLYVYYERREQANEGRFAARRAPGVYSENVQSGGVGYGTMAPPATAPPPNYR